MSSWDTDPWSNFCDPHWELICPNKWHLGTSEISTPNRKSCRDAFPCASMVLKLPRYFYLLMEKFSFLPAFKLLGLRKPHTHVGNLSNYTWDKEKCIKEVSWSSFSILNYNNMARRFNQRNKKGNFFKVLYEQREG